MPGAGQRAQKGVAEPRALADPFRTMENTDSCSLRSDRRSTGATLGLVIAAAWLAAGCVVHTSGESHDWIRESASNDLGCPKGKLTITHYMGKKDKKKAEGCGKTAIYHEVCQGQQCRWERQP